MHLLLYASLHQTQLCVRALLYMHVRVHVVYWGYMKYRLHGDKSSQNGLRSPAWTRRGKREEMGPEARLSCVYILRGSESGRVPILPLPPTSPLRTPHSLPLSLCWPAPLRASRGRFLPQLGVLGCVAACLYWSVDFLVAACTYLNIPPAAALCSRPRTAPPLLPSSTSTRLTLLSLSHPLFCFITPTLRVLSSSLFTVHFPLFLSGPLSLPHFLKTPVCLLPTPVFLIMLSLLLFGDSVSLALSPLALM